MQTLKPLGPIALFAALLTSATVQADGPGPYTIFDGPGAGALLFSINGFNVADPPFTGGILQSHGGGCGPGSLVVGNVTLGPTDRHFHGQLNGTPDPAGSSCGHGRAAPGVYTGLFAPAFTQGGAKVLVLPHILEVSGSILNTPNTFDTQVFMSYAGGRTDAPVGAATVDLYLFDNASGAPLQGSANEVCNPCDQTIGSGSLNRKTTVNVDDQIVGNGGGFSGSVALGFGVVVVGGATDEVAIQGFVVNSHSGPLDLSVFGFEPVELSAAANQSAPFAAAEPNLGLTNAAGSLLALAPLSTQQRLAGLEETPGSTDVVGGAIDTLIKALYVGGLAANTATQGVTVTLTLFHPDGTPLRGLNGDAVMPLAFSLDDQDRVFSMTLEQILAPTGGVAAPISAYAIADIAGDIANFVLAGYVIETGSGPLDLLRFDQRLGSTVIPLPPTFVALMAGLAALSRRRLAATARASH